MHAAARRPSLATNTFASPTPRRQATVVLLVRSYRSNKMSDSGNENRKRSISELDLSSAGVLIDTQKKVLLKLAMTTVLAALSGIGHADDSNCGNTARLHHNSAVRSSAATEPAAGPAATDSWVKLSPALRRQNRRRCDRCCTNVQGFRRGTINGS
jgi:hypothetical protein